MANPSKNKSKTPAPQKGTSRLQLDLGDDIIAKIDKTKEITDNPVRKNTAEKSITWIFSYSKWEEVLKAAKVEFLEKEVLKARKG